MKKEKDETKTERGTLHKRVLEFNEYLEKRARELRLEEENFRNKVLSKKVDVQRL